jgi:hypothetical protein
MMHNNTWYPHHYEMGVSQAGFGSVGPAFFLGASLFGFIFILVIIWAVAIKGYALWHAAKRNEKWWFIALLLINTLGILELIYLITVAKVLFQGKKTHHHAHEHGNDPTSSEVK